MGQGKRWKDMYSALAAVLLSGMIAAPAMAGNIYLTGHDVDFHGGQNGYDTVILNYLRGAGTSSEIAAGSYRIGILRSSEIGGSLTQPVGFGTITTMDPTANLPDAAAWNTFLGGIDVLLIASHQNCGGCDLSTADSNHINLFATEIANFFNAGGDIYANTGADLATYYNFLPAGVIATGAPISGSTGFTATAEGVAIGITNSNMINGHQTHNRFTTFSSAFTVFEVRGTEVVSIGARDATIGGGGITVPSGVPEPSTILMLASGLGLLAGRRWMQSSR